MKNPIIISILCFLLCGHFSFAQDNVCIKKFSWLTGTWKMEEEGKAIIEEWTPAGTSSLKLKSYEVKGNDTTLIERASIGCLSGKQVFTNYPLVIDASKDKMPVSFVLVSERNNTFVFENMSHDFPQRVVYQMVNEDECHAWIEGVENEKLNKIDFYYRRVK